MSKSSNQKLEEELKNQLGLKYSAAGKLLKDAKASLGIGPDEVLDRNREEEIIDEAIIIFEDDLTEEEREAMRVKTKTEGETESAVEPEWKQRARLAAEKREKRWAEEEAQRKQAEEEEARRKEEEQQQQPAPEEYEQGQYPQAADDPELQPVVTRVVRRTTKNKGGHSASKKKKNNDEPTVCYCVIL